MAGRRRVVSFAGAAVLLIASALVQIACSSIAPSLKANLADGAKDIPLDKPLEVTASGARLSRVFLERIDQPGSTIEVPVNETLARVEATLEPDARYRLSATAEPAGGTPLPWTQSKPVSLERTFSTVRAPVLAGFTQPLLYTRDRPLELQFSEPLARLRADVTAGSVQTEIASDDPHKVRIELHNVRPGQELEVQLSDLVGKNGAPGAEQTVQVRTPDPAELVSINGAQVSNRVTLPRETNLVLDWSEPVTWVRYRLGDSSEMWTGAPTTRVELAPRIPEGETRALIVEDASTEEGGWMPRAINLEVAATAPLRVAAFWPAAGATGIMPNADPTVRFNEPIANREAIEQAISFEPSVPGRWEWQGPDKVHFVPAEYFPRETEIRMSWNGGANGLRGASGGYLVEAGSTTFTTGKMKVIDVSIRSQRMTLYEDDVAVWSAPVATGVVGADTPLGTFNVQAKRPVARFRGVNVNGSRYDIPDVHWVLDFYGDYTIHGAYWRGAFGRPGSNGCVSLSDPNAKVVFDFADIGTQINIHM
jgi:lipoprotein-anchoring transpeptidase ErfK/SrfK